MTTEIEEIGRRLQEAFASSQAEGHALRKSYYSDDGCEVFHVPPAHVEGAVYRYNADGLRLENVPGSDVLAAGEAEAAQRGGPSPLDRIGLRLEIDSYRQIFDDTLVLDLFFTGTLPDGEDYRFRNVFLYTVRDGKFVRLVEVASKEMWDFFAQASQRYGAP